MPITTDTITNILNIATVASAVANVVMAIATGLLVYLAWKGLGQWQAQLRGQANLELARSLIQQVLDFRDRYHKARKVIGSKDVWGTYNNGLQPARESVVQLRATKAEVKVLFGDQIATFVTPFETALADLEAATIAYFDPNAAEPFNGLSKEKQQKILDRMYGTPDDQYGQAVNKAVDNLVTALGPYLLRKK